MHLISFRVREFQSIRDSGDVPVNDITCLVGKNEAGKSALLKALYRLNPVVPTEGQFDVTSDYPRMEVEDYRHDVEAGNREVVKPITASFALDQDESEAIKKLFGEECMGKGLILTLTKDYDNKRTFNLPVNGSKAIGHFISNADLSEQTQVAVKAAHPTAEALLTVLKGEEQTEEVKRLTNILTAI